MGSFFSKSTIYTLSFEDISTDEQQFLVDNMKQDIQHHIDLCTGFVIPSTCILHKKIVPSYEVLDQAMKELIHNVDSNVPYIIYQCPKGYGVAFLQNYSHHMHSCLPCSPTPRYINIPANLPRIKVLARRYS